MSASLGIDTGGTFIDICMIDEGGNLSVLKVDSVPDQLGAVIASGAERILVENDRRPDHVGYFGHGTTVATNALLERRGALTGLVTTDGFRDLIDIARQRRPHLYDLQVEKPPVLSRRFLRKEVAERIDFAGEVIKPLDRDALRKVIGELKSEGIESIAVCFLYSYLRPEHEREAREIIQEIYPGAYVSLSHEVVSEFREYERFSTTVINSFVGPVISRYLGDLKAALLGAGITVRPYVTQSNGGVISLDIASELPVRTVLSGPAAGVVGASKIATLAGMPDIITFDMGGTSTDVSLINGGSGTIRTDAEVAGYPVRSPMLDVHTVGAGGGSIGWLDTGSHLQVGPRSAGAVPGPACYDRGGVEPTITDANVVLGTLDRNTLLGGQMAIDAAAADAAVDSLAERLGLTREETAHGMIDMAIANIVRAVRVVSVQRGYDPRDYALVAFGGAGPLHASRLAEELEIKRVLIPPRPGLLCAVGLLLSDLRTDYSRTQLLDVEATSIPALSATFDELLKEAEQWYATEGISKERRRTTRIIDMRYVGQNYELSVEVPDGSLTDASVGELMDRFVREHERAYGYSARGERVQFVTLRVMAIGLNARPALSAAKVLKAKTSITRRVHFRNLGYIETAVFARSGIAAAARVDGPAIIEQMDTTIVIAPGQFAISDDAGNLILHLNTTMDKTK